MSNHPFSDVVIAGASNTRQARTLEGHTSLSITLEAVRKVITFTGIAATEIDGIFSGQGDEVIHQLGIGPIWYSYGLGTLTGVLQAASLIASGLCSVVLVASGEAGLYTNRSATAPWTRPTNEFVASFGMYTAVEFALIARRHMEMFGTKPEHLAEVAATIRNNGHVNPEAVYFDRGPYKPEDILASRMVVDPFHLLDCSTTSEGGAAVILTTAERARDLRHPAVSILGGGVDHMAPAYRHAPSWDLSSRTSDDVPNGYVGRRAARKAFRMAGLSPRDVDCCEFYDPFSFEIIRQFEAFEFCGPGEGPDFVMDGSIAIDGPFPVTTDGGTMSFSHPGGTTQMLQRVVRGTHQIQQVCTGNQVRDPQVVMCTNGGAGAMHANVILLGSEPA